MILGTTRAIYALLFALAVAHKVRTLATGNAANEPMLARPSFLAKHATLTLAAAGAAEAWTIVTVAFAPRVGFTLAILLVGTYTAALVHQSDVSDCHCFGAALAGHSRTVALVRNGMMIGIAAACLVLLTTSAVGPGSVGAVEFAAAVALVAPAIAVSLVGTIAMPASDR